MRRGIRRAIAVAAVFTTCFVWDDGGAAAASWRHSRYVLVMSADDAVCKPLTNVYNRLLRKWLKNPKRTELVYFSNGSLFGAIPPMTDFEVTNPSAFAEAGLFPPKPVETMPDRTLYYLDIWGDGDRRLVSVKDNFEGQYYGPDFTDRVTMINVFKKGLTLQNISWPKDPPANWAPSLIDPAYLDGTADYMFLATSQKNMLDGHVFITYFLKKWPLFSRGSKKNRPPILGGFGTIRIFENSNKKLYFIRNDGILFPPKPDEHSIVVYNIIQKKPYDVCYVSLTNK